MLAAVLLGVLAAGLFVLLVLPLLAELLVTPSYPAPHPSGGVVVTGASTGIGEDAAVTLAKKGFLVFAGVRRAEDGAKLLARHASIIPVTLDVTKQEQVEQALAFVRAELAKRGLPLVRFGHGCGSSGPVGAWRGGDPSHSYRTLLTLYDTHIHTRARTNQTNQQQVGLMNNAGLPGYSEPVEFLSMEQLRGVFDVNFFGLVATTKAFLPLLREGQGRIVNMSRWVGGIH